jgi:hypothetical protein|tara:strand:+ start:785 stop:1747 length:963 start_codon:yes stop_codon:yes gene_type:complete
MNSTTINILKGFRKLYGKANSTALPKPICDQDPDSVSQRIYSRLMSDEPCMIARFGAFELATIVNYLGVKKGKQSLFNYVKGNELDWWWNDSLINAMHTNAGFFPPTHAKIKQFCELMLEDIPQVDILGSWLPSEHLFDQELRMVPKVRLGLLDPYWANKPWTKALKDKKVLVVHPFTDTIEKQYKNRALLFNNNLLPNFELKTIKAVQTIAGTKSDFKDWFEALNFMKSEIDKTDYDICLIGAGAYGFPLAAHVKRTGKKAVHMGGSLQLLFGIRGKRWESTDYNEIYDYASLVNKYWVKPSRVETPNKSSNVEDGCYW